MKDAKWTYTMILKAHMTVLLYIRAVSVLPMTMPWSTAEEKKRTSHEEPPIENAYQEGQGRKVDG
jgi:hypothetical protein